MVFPTQCQREGVEEFLSHYSAMLRKESKSEHLETHVTLFLIHWYKRNMQIKLYLRKDTKPFLYKFFGKRKTIENVV